MFILNNLIKILGIYTKKYKKLSKNKKNQKIKKNKYTCVV